MADKKFIQPKRNIREYKTPEQYLKQLFRLNKEEIIKVMGMGMSDDIETIKLANSLLHELCPEFLYELYMNSGYSTLDSMWFSDLTIYDFHHYIMMFRRRYFPGLIYSPYTKTFKGYVGS